MADDTKEHSMVQLFLKGGKITAEQLYQKKRNGGENDHLVSIPTLTKLLDVDVFQAKAFFLIEFGKTYRFNNKWLLQKLHEINLKELQTKENNFGER